MSSTAQVVQRYIELTNTPGSPSFDLFADKLEWREVHSGRSGGQQELFAAMKESRDMFDNIRVEASALIIDGESACLEAIWSGRVIADYFTMSMPVVFIFGARGGKIVKKIRYVIIPPR